MGKQCANSHLSTARFGLSQEPGGHSYMGRITEGLDFRQHHLQAILVFPETPLFPYFQPTRLSTNTDP